MKQSERDTVQEALNALETMYSGILWYIDICPLRVDGSDYEALSNTEKSITKLRALLAQPVEPLKHYAGLIAVLLNQEQCDDSGERCSVSRQAVDEAIDILASNALAVPAEPVAWEDWRRVLAEKVDAYIQGEYEGEGAGDVAYEELKAHILKTPFAVPQQPAPVLGEI